MRIAQEALTNVRRHARAQEVEITLRVTAGRVRLAIRDDGEGFDAEAIEAGHHGLVGMRERARLIGGRLRVESGPGQGTLISLDARLPSARTTPPPPEVNRP